MATKPECPGTTFVVLATKIGDRVRKCEICETLYGVAMHNDATACAELGRIEAFRARMERRIARLHALAGMIPPTVH